MPSPEGRKIAMMIIGHDNGVSLAEAKSIINDNSAGDAPGEQLYLNDGDEFRQRVTGYPASYDQVYTNYQKSVRSRLSNFKIGLDIAYYNKIVEFAQEIKNLGFDYIEYNVENAFDAPNSDSEAQNNLSKIRQAAAACHAAGLSLTVAPGKPNSTSFERTGLLDEVAREVDGYHIQAQTLQANPPEYVGFVSNITSKLRAANPSIRITSQVSPGNESLLGKTSQEKQALMRACISGCVDRGTTDGFGMWITGSPEVQNDARLMYQWFKQRYL